MKGWLWALWLALLLSLGLNIGLVVAGREQRAPAPRPAAAPTPENDRGRLDNAARRLGLEGEKRERFVAQQRRFVTSVMAERRKLERIRREVRAELRSESPDEARLQELARRSGEAYGALDAAFIENIVRSRELLDPEQERAFMGFLGRMRARALDR